MHLGGSVLQLNKEKKISTRKNSLWSHEFKENFLVTSPKELIIGWLLSLFPWLPNTILNCVCASWVASSYGRPPGMGGPINSQFPRGLLCTYPWAAIWWWQCQETEAEAQGAAWALICHIKNKYIWKLGGLRASRFKGWLGCCGLEERSPEHLTWRLPSLVSCLNIDTASSHLHWTALINTKNGSLYSLHVYSF